MTTFNTGNPIGSTDARDLSDNAENFDKALNTPEPTWDDRLGATRDTFEGALSKMSFYRVGDFATGYTLTNMRQTLEYSGHEYSWAGAFPKVVAAGATPATSGGIGAGAWVDRTDETLRGELVASGSSIGDIAGLKQNLSGADGDGFVGYATYAQIRAYTGNKTTIRCGGRTAVFTGDGAHGVFYRDDADTASADNDCTILVDALGRRWKRKINGVIKAVWAGMVESITVSQSAALQKAIDTVFDIALANNRPYGVPCVEIDAGRYRMDSAVTLPPWIKIKSKGTLLLDFSYTADTTTNGFIIRNTHLWSYPVLGLGTNMSPCLNGTDGLIEIRGPGRDGVSTGNGVLLGNDVAGYTECRDVNIKNVILTQWGTGIRYTTKDVYLSCVENCSICFNDINVAYPEEVAANSGERQSWINCTFAAAKYCFSHTGGRWENFFVNCSFDFHGDIVHLWEGASYAQYKFTNCYFEGWDGYLVNASTTGVQNHVEFDMCTFLPTEWRMQDGSIVPSASRKLINGSTRLSVVWRGHRIIYNMRPYLEDSYVIGNLENVTEFSFGADNSFPAVPEARGIVNRDYDFQLDAGGTLGSALTAWDRVPGFADISTNQIATVDGKKVLQLVGTSTSSAISFISKNAIPCTPGTRFACNAALKTSASGTILVSVGVEFFDVAGVSLGVFPSFRQYDFTAALADTTVPNYASGTNRWMDTNANTAIAPKNAATGKCRINVSGFNGTVNISRARMWTSTK